MAVMKKFGPPVKQQTYLTKFCLLTSLPAEFEKCQADCTHFSYLTAHKLCTWFTEKTEILDVRDVVLNKRGLVCVCVLFGRDLFLKGLMYVCRFE
jgi:hypothetical protein